jgi:hypothetical protein
MKLVRKFILLALVFLGCGAAWTAQRFLDSRFVHARSLHSLGITPECGYFMVNKAERFALASCSEKTFRQLANAPDNIVASGISVYTKKISGSGVVFESKDGFAYQYSPFESPDFESKLLESLIPVPTDDYLMVIKKLSGSTRRSYQIYFFPGETKEGWGNLVVTWSAD